MTKKSLSPAKRRLLVIFLTLMLLAAAGGLGAYWLILFPNTARQEATFLNIPTGSDFGKVMQLLEEEKVLKNTAGFELLARRIGYDTMVKPGRYEFRPGMNNKQLLGMLKSGRQSPVNLVLRSSWNKEKLIGFVASKLETDSMFLLNMLNDAEYLKKYDLTPENVTAIFVPNTYSFYWNTDATVFFERMVKEYQKFWNKSRTETAAAIGLTPMQVSILASIVEKETAKGDEMARVAGVYVNRINKDMLLQADPTVIFAVGNPDIRRVKGIHLQFDSPYNTYMYKGLPPGPICMPSIQCIEAVLHYERHKYIYFCAREDFSGYHNFAVTSAEHLLNRDKYIFELNKRGIR